MIDFELPKDMKTLTKATETFQVLEGKAGFKLHVQISILLFYLCKVCKWALKNTAE